MLERAVGEHLTFVPASLPPAINYDLSLVRLLSEADLALGELAGVGQMLPNPHLLIRPFMRREAVLSSRIEGTVTQLDQLLLFEAQPNQVGQPADVEEVINYVRALELGLKHVQEGRPLILRLLREVHAQLLHGVRGENKRPGEFRNCPVLIGRQGQSYEGARFVPPATRGCGGCSMTLRCSSTPSSRCRPSCNWRWRTISSRRSIRSPTATADWDDS